MVDVDDEPSPVETKKEVPVVNEGVVEKVEPNIMLRMKIRILKTINFQN